MQGFLKNLYKIFGVHLQYKSAIINQLDIHDFNNIYFSNPNHFYVISTIIQNE